MKNASIRIAIKLMNISAEYFINNEREKGKLVGRIVCDCGD